MIERYDFFSYQFQREASKELRLLSIVSQTFFQPFSFEDNLLVILTALTSGSGVGFNRAMLFLAERQVLRGQMWLGPRSPEEAKNIWEILSTPGIGYLEVLEYNRSLMIESADVLTNRVKGLSYSLDEENGFLPVLPAQAKKIMLVRDARNEPLVDKKFLEILGADEFLCLPLVGGGELVGEIVLDNAIIRAPIATRDVELASICGLIAGNYIYATTLHRKLIEMEQFAAMGEMAMHITHQLRNPLVTIGGFTDQILRGSPDPGRTKRNLEIIREEVRRLEEIIFELGHFLKVEIETPEPIRISKIIKSILRSPEIRRKSHGRAVRIELARNNPPILCDQTYVREAVRNIIDNSLDATPPGGSVTISARRENKKWLCISVQDNGKGMSEGVLKRIFDPFFTTKEKGMGLGLIFVKRVMDACGGKIEVESRDGEGTLFRLYFKCCPTEGEK
jgi:signal transduction histidine kinase